ncbi:hypothetical protein AZ78_5341 [Lysobacter capsici AZ78]|uniref:Uncharacterized protein n=1 Tax=Lysobacter capsici AZ78 TaxID=1444315 RepID=A0A125TZX4_9GAMM|nr:hypothetical protein AZ78_5341 [Lysobacter capsici AZ78]
MPVPGTEPGKRGEAVEGCSHAAPSVQVWNRSLSSRSCFVAVKSAPPK